jgi:hypothetical protein
MTISYQGTSVATGTTSASIAKPSNIVNGDCMVCFVCDRATSGQAAAPTGWTRVIDASGASGRIQVYWGIYGQNGIGQGPWSFTGTTRILARIVSYRGVHPAPMDVTPSARYNASGTYGTTSITPVTNGNWVLAAFAFPINVYTWSAESVATSTWP